MIEIIFDYLWGFYALMCCIAWVEERTETEELI